MTIYLRWLGETSQNVIKPRGKSWKQGRFEVNLWDFKDESGSPSQFWRPESGKSLKLWYEKIRDKLPGFYDFLIWERERTVSWNVQIDLNWSNLFFETFLSLEPWKFLGTFRQVNIKRGEEGVEAFRIKGEWQHLSAFAQKSILLQCIKWLQSYGKTYRLWYTIDLLVILRIGSQILFASVLSTNLAHWCGSEACLKSYPDDIGARNSLRKKTRALWELCPPPGKKTLDIDSTSTLMVWLGLKNRVPQKKTTNLGPL